VLPVLPLLSFSQPMTSHILLVSSFLFFFSFFFKYYTSVLKSREFQPLTISFTANPLSISQISSVGGGFCTFFGIDGSETTVVGAQTVPVGPPQTQVSGVCDIL
jgi:hypothetical protein